jgi:hypothetical protein
MFAPRAASVYFPADRIRPIRIVPGFRERRPLVSVKWNFSYEKDRFDDEAVWQSTVALTKLGPGRFDPEPWPEESGKYIYSGAQARVIARRTGQALGTGLIQWRYLALDQYPEVECGDVAAVGTTRFLAKDPHSTRAVRGHLVALATITDCSYADGMWTFTGWVQSYADILSGPTAAQQILATADTVVLEDAHALYALGKLYVNWRGSGDTVSVKIARSAVSYPAAGTGTAYDGQSGVQDTGTIPYNTPTYVTVTPYSGLGGALTQGAAIQFTANYAILDPMMINPGTGLVDPAGSTPRNRCSVFHSSNVAITDVTLTTLAWDSENFDIGTLHDTATNNSRITIPTGGNVGLWLFVCQVRWIGVAAGTAGARYVNIRKNGTTVVAENYIGAVPVTGAGNPTVQTVTALQNAPSVGDYFEVQVYHDDGGSRSVQGGSWLTFFSAHHLW